MQLQKLEEELGIIIFDRSKRPILPTEVGEKIILQARAILREHKKLYTLVESDASLVSGKFTLAVIPTISPYLIPLFLQKFSLQYPDVELEVLEAQTHDIIAMLERDEIDGGILATPLGNENLIERILYYEPFYLLAAPEHPILKKKYILETELPLDDLWLLEEGHCLRQQVLSFCQGKHQGAGKTYFKSGNLETLIRLVRHGQGLTLLPELALSGFSTKERRELVRPFKRPIPTREISLAHSRLYLKEKIIVALEDVIIQSLPATIFSHKRKDICILPITPLT